MLSSKSAVCDSKKKLDFIKEKEVSGFLGSLERKVLILTKVPTAVEISF